jgi:hypothetical protein
LNWFRKSPSKADSLELEEIGYKKYSEIHDVIDSTLVAQHLKRQLLKINLGLLPESICNLLKILIQDSISHLLTIRSFRLTKGCGMALDFVISNQI